jgi:hypothetical protein
MLEPMPKLFQAFLSLPWLCRAARKQTTAASAVPRI